MTVRIASCSCGQLTATVSDNPLDVCVCHCLACQRRTGSVFSAQARFDVRSVVIKGEAKQFVRVGDAGSTFIFAFCPDCGATVHYAEKGDDDFVAIPVGAFADPAFPMPEISVYGKRKHSWVSLPDNIKLWREDPT